MKAWIWIATLTLSTISLSRAEARGHRTRPESSPESFTQSCMTQLSGIRHQTQMALGEARSPLYDKMDSINWDKFCKCYGPKTYEIKKNPPPGPDYDSRPMIEAFNKVAVECAIAHVDNSSNTTSKASTTPAHKPDPTNKAKFDELINNCRTNPRAILMFVESTLKAKNNPRADSVKDLNVDRLCECHINSVRAAVGDEMYLLNETSWHTPPGVDTMKLGTAKEKSYETCAAEQISLKIQTTLPTQPNLPAQQTILPNQNTIKANESFMKLFQSSLISGKGIGGLELNQTLQQMTQLLGTTNKVEKKAEEDRYFYGPGGELTVVCAPSGPACKVQYIYLNSRYQALTDKAIRMGEDFSMVKKKHGLVPILAETLRGHLIFRDGTMYYFNQDNKLSGIALATPENPQFSYYLNKK